jgi:ketosteroid isomerase-like protein
MISPLDVVRTFYARLAQGDLPAVLGLLDPKVEWTEAERFPYYGGIWHGPEALTKGLFEPLRRDWSSFAVNAERFVAEGDQVVGLGHYAGTHKATGRSVTAGFAHHWTVRSGTIVRFVQYTDTAKILDAMNRR